VGTIGGVSIAGNDRASTIGSAVTTGAAGAGSNGTTGSELAVRRNDFVAAASGTTCGVDGIDGARTLESAARINAGASGTTTAALASPMSGSARKCAALAVMTQMATAAAANESFRVALRFGFRRRSTRRTTSGVLVNNAGTSEGDVCA
jgi:hypothetical protein